MRVLVTTEERFWQCRGHTYVIGISRYDFWKRYLDDFDQVVVLGRALPVERVEPEWQQVDGERVSVAALPYYLGPGQYLRRYQALRRAVQRNVSPADAIVLRVPSPVAMRLGPWLRKTKHPYGLEVNGDPYDMFAPGAIIHPLAPFFRYLFTRQLRRQCAGAAAVAYITSSALQRRYPAGPRSFSICCSDCDLPLEAFISEPRVVTAPKDSSTLISVGSMAQMYKAPDVLIKAVAQLARAGRDLRLVLVGDGRHRPELEELAATLDLGSRVVFTGQLAAGKPVRDELDRADLFILPSRAEALGRAIIEAMARGLPCIGSTAGGIPELLPPEDLVPPGDVHALADKIGQVLDDPVRMTRMSENNLKKSFEWRDEILRERRAVFFRVLRERTEKYIQGLG
jgi:glycosyltransferase involved in cell wall biosynthesis